MRGAPPTLEAVSLEVVVSLPIPQSWSRKKQQAARWGVVRPTSRPDIDNYIKAVFDGCNEIVWKDDSQVVQVTATKRHSHSRGISVRAQWENRTTAALILQRYGHP
jgi:Holliday junction resolvase RusA-like endonuclease